jgi:apolipoprotein D and lipocalin family protein
MASWKRIGACGLAGAVLCGCASIIKDRPQAPQPLKAVDQRRLYAGLWYEYARTPTKDARNCFAPTTEFFRDGDGSLFEKDTCHPAGSRGKDRASVGAVEILNPGPDNKVLVRIKVMGAFYVPKVTWIIDHGMDYGWFIACDPEFKTVSIFTREPHPLEPLQRKLVDKLRALGWSGGPLDHPAPAA